MQHSIILYIFNFLSQKVGLYETIPNRLEYLLSRTVPIAEDLRQVFELPGTLRYTCKGTETEKDRGPFSEPQR